MVSEEPLDARRRILDASIALETLVRLVTAAHRAGAGHGLSVEAMSRLAWSTVHGLSLLWIEKATQLSASYYLSDAWTVSAFGSANVGDARSERGSFPQRGSGILQLSRYL